MQAVEELKLDEGFIMVLIGDGVKRVRAYALPVGVGADGGAVNEPLSVLVSWLSGHNDKLYQIYVNGEFCGYTEDVSERQAIVHCRPSWQSSIRIEVFAVEPDGVLEDHSNEVELGGSSRVRLSWVRLAEFGFDSVVEVFSDNGSGEMDYQIPVAELDCWSVMQDKWGFGLCSFGCSDFGYDGAGAVGFGRGTFGGGEFGFDAEAMEWISGELDAGEYRFAVKIKDAGTNTESLAWQTGPITILPAAKGANELELASYDIESGLLVLSF